MLRKLLWGLNALLYIPFVKSIRFPTYIGPATFTKGLRNVVIGKKVRIFPRIRIETYGQGGIIIGDDVSIGQNFHIISGEISPPLTIGAHTTISGNVLITNIDHEYRELDKHIMEQQFLIRHTSIGENCFIGYGAAIQAGTILGQQCIVGANSVVRGTFPDYCVIVGAPARIVKRYNFELGLWEPAAPDGSFLSVKK